MSEEITFATSAFGGYEKKEVQDYLLTLNEEYRLSQKQADARFKIADAQLHKETALLAEKDDLLDAANDKIIQLKENIITEQHRQRALSVSLETLEQKNAQYERLLDSLRKKSGGSGSNTSEKEVVKMEEEKKKLQEDILKNKESTAQIGQVLLTARIQADEILSKAKRQAASFLQESELIAQQLLRDLKSEIKDHRMTEAEKLSAKVSSMNVELEQKITYLSRSMDETVGTITKQSADVMSYFAQFGGILRQLEGMSEEMESIKKSAEDSVVKLKDGLGTALTKDYLRVVIADITSNADEKEAPIYSYSITQKAEEYEQAKSDPLAEDPNEDDEFSLATPPL